MIIQYDGQISIEAGNEPAGLTALGWDTEGTGRAGINLMKSPVVLRMVYWSGKLVPQVKFAAPGSHTVQFTYTTERGGKAVWETEAGSGGLHMRIAWDQALADQLRRLELVFPFDPTVTATSVISSRWLPDGRFQLPAILSAPDMGQMLMTCTEQPGLAGRIEGSRAGRWFTMALELPIFSDHTEINLQFSPVVLPLPPGYADERRWRLARRGWFNMIHLSCGASGGEYRDVAGVWANNMLSDPVSSIVFVLADTALLVPDLAPGVPMASILRRSVDYWIHFKTYADGLIAYTAKEPIPEDTDSMYVQGVMDANPAVLIGAWSYVKASGDLEWLERTVGNLEFVSRYIEKRDIDGDGLVESRQNGNAGSRPPRSPDCAWDCYCSGHKNAYTNVLAYRAWRCMAHLEGLLGRQDQQQRFIRMSERLKAAFCDEFYNPETGWLGWWRSLDGVLHDVYSDLPTSAAITYGLIDREKGAAMLEKYWQALEKTGFARFDLGVPVTIRPVPVEEMECYFPFEHFLNGGCCLMNTVWFIDALYRVGMTARADRIVDAMLERQAASVFPNGGGYQNGFVDRDGEGAEVFDWSGNPTGYEGHLVYCWTFMHAMLRREPELLQQVYGEENA